MQQFEYRVKDQKGKTLKGIIEAANKKQAAALLRDQGYLIISLNPKTESFSFLKRITARITENDLVEFTRQLSTMINSGLPLVETLLILKNQTKNYQMAKVIDGLLGEVQGGASLAAAMENYPQVFPKVYISLIKAGELSGLLDNVSLRLAETLERQRDFASKTKGALVYPAIITIAMIGVMVIMMTVVFPKMTAMYKDFNVPLPGPTLFLMKISDLSIRFSPLILLFLIALAIFYKFFSETEKGRYKIDQFIFKLPLYGSLKKQIALTEFARTLGLLIGTGIPIIEALNIVAETVGNAVYKKGIEEAALEVERGLSLAVPISHNPDFPPIVSQMIKVGEESGKMDEVLEKLSRYFESETEHLIKGLTTAIEPIIMIILGLGVGFIIISVLLPIYNLTGQF